MGDGKRPATRTPAIHSVIVSAATSIALRGGPVDLVEQPRDDLAIGPLRPPTNDAAVTPDRRSGVARGVEQAGSVVGS